MGRAAIEANPEWVSEQVKALLSSYPEHDVKNTMPVILMFMVDEFGVDNLIPPVRAGVERVLERAGIDNDCTNDEVKERMERFIGGLDVNRMLLADIQDIYFRHREAIAENKSGLASRLLGRKVNKQRAPSYGAAMPVGAVSLASLAPLMRRV